MSQEVNKEQTKDASQEKTTELTDDQLDEAAGGEASSCDTSTLTIQIQDAGPTDAQLDEAAGGDKRPGQQKQGTSGDSGDEKAFEDVTRSLGLG